MAVVSESMAAVLLAGDTLDPDEVSALLGHAPTRGWRKGEPAHRMRSGAMRPARSGLWRLKAAPRRPADLDAQAAELLDALSPDLAAWRALTGRFRGELFCGLFMEGSNEGLSLSARTLQALGERGLELQLDIYAPLSDEPAP